MSNDKPIAVVGTGQIGASWAALFLANGFDVDATDPGPDAEQQLRSAVDAAWPTLTVLGTAPGADPGRLRFHRDVRAAVAGAAFIQESGPEYLAVKHEVNALIESAAAPDAIVASSTSALRASDIQRGRQHPSRFLVGHPFNPPHLIPLVEVVGGEATSEDVVNAAIAFYRSIGKKPIRIRRELPGHVGNRLQVAMFREAFSLVQQGVVDVADLDEAIASGPGLRWAFFGPFLNLHASGGAEGISHAFDHLGPMFRSVAADLAPYPADDEFEPTVIQGVEDELGGRDFDELLVARDEALLDLLRSKRRLGLDASAP